MARSASPILTVRNALGVVQTSATYRVLNAGTAVEADIFSTESGGVETVQPASVDANGQIYFYAAAGKYDIEVTNDGNTNTIYNVRIGTAQGFEIVTTDGLSGQVNGTLKISNVATVGTTTDNGVDKLQIAGTVRATGAIKSETWFQAINGSNNAYFGISGTHAFIEVSGANNIIFNANGAQKAIIDSAGRMGLGINSPNRHFDLGNGTETGYLDFSTGVFTVGTGDALRFMSDDTERARFASGGNFLIGTTTDDGSSKLQVSGATAIYNGSLTVEGSSASAQYLYVRNNESSAYATLHVGGSTAFGIPEWVNSTVLESVPGTGGGLALSAYSGNIIFQTNARTEAGRISSAGRLLLGTTTDDGSNKLQVNGAGIFKDLLTASVVESNAQLKLDRTGASAGSGYLGASADYALELRAGDLSTVLLNVTQSGRLLLGTSDDGSSRIYANGNIKGAAIISVVGGITTVTGADVDGGYVETQGSNNLRFYAGGTEKIRIRPGGNILIGTTTDDGSNKLQVNGGAAIAGALTINSAGGWGSFKSASVGDSYSFFYKGGTSTIVGFIGTDGGAILGGGSGDNFGIRAQTDLIFCSGGGSERARITSAGNLLVGTTTDDGYQLDLGGGTTVNQRLRLQRGSDDANQAMRLGWNSIDLARLDTALASAQTDFSITQTGSDGTRTPLYISTSGNVLVATTTDDGTYKLQVEGGIKASTGNIFSFISGGGASVGAGVDTNNMIYMQRDSGNRNILQSLTSGSVAPLYLNWDGGIVLIRPGADTVDPTTTEIPSGLYGLWKNTTSGEVRMWYNDGGVMKKSAAFT